MNYNWQKYSTIAFVITFRGQSLWKREVLLGAFFLFVFWGGRVGQTLWAFFSVYWLAIGGGRGRGPIILKFPKFGPPKGPKGPKINTSSSDAGDSRASRKPQVGWFLRR